MNYATYKGYGIEIRDDLGDEDVKKLVHGVFLPGSWETNHHGQILCKTIAEQPIMLDLSPYGTWDYDLCAAVIDLGFPTRKDVLPNGSLGSLNREDVETLWRAKFGDTPMPKVEIT